MLHTIVEWQEQEPVGKGVFIPRSRAFKYDDVKDNIVDFEHDKETCRYPMKLLADKDLSIMTNHEAKKLVRFCKNKLGVN